MPNSIPSFPFSLKQIVLLGFGGVAQAFLEIFFKEQKEMAETLSWILIDPKDLTQTPCLSLFPPLCQMGKNQYFSKDKRVCWLKESLSKENFYSLLSPYLNSTTVLIDLSYRCCTLDLMHLTEKKGALYMNAALDFWGGVDLSCKDPYATSLEFRWGQLEQGMKGAQRTKLACMGMNPGLVNIFVLETIRKAGQLWDPIAYELALQGSYDLAAERLGLTLIQISEQDTQLAIPSRLSKETAYCTWSPTGLIDEALNTPGIGIGTHEKEIFRQSTLEYLNATGHIFMQNYAVDIKIVSADHNGRSFVGVPIPHQESFTLSKMLTTYKKNGKARYRPSIYYVYDVAECTKSLLNQALINPNLKTDILKPDQIDSGYDSCGVLLYFRRPEGLRTLWTGSLLDHEEAKKLSSFSNATLIQVGIGLYAGLDYMLKNPNLGLMTSEKLDIDQTFAVAKSYLGTFETRDVTLSYQPKGDCIKDLVINESSWKWKKIK